MVCLSACQGMFAEFAESFSSASVQRELFEPLLRYECICTEKIDILQRLVACSVPTHSTSVNLCSFCLSRTLLLGRLAAAVTHKTSCQD